MASSSSSSSTIQIHLSPKPGFCIKTSTLPGAVVASPPPGTTEKIAVHPTSVPEGLKVFVNIAWDPNVPPSPPGSEGAILRTIRGEDVAEDDASGFYIPAVVSSVREDRDKAGNPSLVFDCVYNTSMKACLMSDPEVRPFLVELSLQRIESQTGLVLSREIKTPNISSKGKLLPRTAQVSAALLLETPLETKASTNKTSTTMSASTSVAEAHFGGIDDRDEELLASVTKTLPPLDWRWSKDAGHLRIDVNTTDITSSLIENATLDVQPRTLRLYLPERGLLEIDLDLADAEISSRVRQAREALISDTATEYWEEEETRRRLTLKRERDFEVENASAEWVIGARTITIHL